MEESNEVKMAFSAQFFSDGNVGTIEWIPMPEYFPEEANIDVYTGEECRKLYKLLQERKHEIKPFDVAKLSIVLAEIKQELNEKITSQCYRVG